MTDLRQAAQQALEALEVLSKLGTGGTDGNSVGTTIAQEAREHLFTALAQPEQQAEPVSMRMPKVGDKVICLEDESFGEVVSLTGGGSPDITFDDGTRGTYLLREFAELFGYAEQRQQQAEPPPEWLLIKNILDEYGLQAIDFVAEWKAAQRPWVGLTPEEILDLFDRNNVYGSKWIEFARTVEAKLKEKNDH